MTSLSPLTPPFSAQDLASHSAMSSLIGVCTSYMFRTISIEESLVSGAIIGAISYGSELIFGKQTNLIYKISLKIISLAAIMFAIYTANITLMKHMSFQIFTPNPLVFTIFTSFVGIINLQFLKSTSSTPTSLPTATATAPATASAPTPATPIPAPASPASPSHTETRSSSESLRNYRKKFQDCMWSHIQNYISTDKTPRIPSQIGEIVNMTQGELEILGQYYQKNLQVWKKLTLNLQIQLMRQSTSCGLSTFPPLSFSEVALTTCLRLHPDQINYLLDFQKEKFLKLWVQLSYQTQQHFLEVHTNMYPAHPINAEAVTGLGDELIRAYHANFCPNKIFPARQSLASPIGPRRLAFSPAAAPATATQHAAAPPSSSSATAPQHEAAPPSSCAATATQHEAAPPSSCAATATQHAAAPAPSAEIQPRVAPSPVSSSSLSLSHIESTETVLEAFYRIFTENTLDILTTLSPDNYSSEWNQIVFQKNPEIWNRLSLKQQLLYHQEKPTHVSYKRPTLWETFSLTERDIQILKDETPEYIASCNSVMKKRLENGSIKQLCKFSNAITSSIVKKAVMSAGTVSLCIGARPALNFLMRCTWSISTYIVPGLIAREIFVHTRRESSRVPSLTL